MKAVAKISFVAATMFAGAAFAGQSLLGELPDYPEGVAVTSNAPAKTRAQVLAELNNAPFNGVELGEMPDYPQGYLAAQQQQLPGKTRAEVRAELAQAAGNGNVRSGGIDYPGGF
ncbi:DUF4148 domain-containing protein [Verticiella sediminum]|uniref:DUF4148 domain-containing protein n=1 Tax=Verticiella sediminum TaxID=1247510 RepID=A0A556AY43_9BURK|nr:DUF4148 domain-containing protein [Verticiella sediminum]TSH97874.1 DUF4148 domain-containing protein [Verticiella sediminum]